jgi:hypothetical protein
MKPNGWPETLRLEATSPRTPSRTAAEPNIGHAETFPGIHRAVLKRVQIRTITIYTEVKMNRKVGSKWF